MSNKTKTSTKRGGKRIGSGRKSRTDLGLPPLVTTSVKVEEEVLQTCRTKYGSISNALRFAAKQ